ncbi:glutaredoxin family protein [Corynebacterium sp. TAE3-ERU12]|uniref:glutaredoxin family protein n=1 Tax=Corynebacterium sp. TAE3-ERU12 TaxID=2849491 RepID=UPI001C46038F|nr:glutaredoxin family protein [Corynebacterium sp. TAE3-ERU12]MBV7294542.1 glutaredoxin family protein [Corynebacterium sp. TAE3-ERU12]
MPTVTVLTRQGCGSCVRVAAQAEPIAVECGAEFVLTDVDSDPSLATEFGDRVPVVLVDDEEIACWELDDDELYEALEQC